jgi:hypothetical protein
VQVNLMHHPDAFPSLADAFDPEKNAGYGARFLARLHADTGDWDRAVGYYHSRTPALAADYQSKVLGVRAGPVLAAANAAPRPPSPLQQLAAAWSATLDGASMGSRPVAFAARPVMRAEPDEVAEAPTRLRARHAGSP